MYTKFWHTENRNRLYVPFFFLKVDTQIIKMLLSLPEGVAKVRSLLLIYFRKMDSSETQHCISSILPKTRA